jgi:hypothetical protein
MNLGGSRGQKIHKEALLPCGCLYQMLEDPKRQTKAWTIVFIRAESCYAEHTMPRQK